MAVCRPSDACAVTRRRAGSKASDARRRQRPALATAVRDTARRATLCPRPTCTRRFCKRRESPLPGQPGARFLRSANGAARTRARHRIAAAAPATSELLRSPAESSRSRADRSRRQRRPRRGRGSDRRGRGRCPRRERWRLPRRPIRSAVQAGRCARAPAGRQVPLQELTADSYERRPARLHRDACRGREPDRRSPTPRRRGRVRREARRRCYGSRRHRGLERSLTRTCAGSDDGPRAWAWAAPTRECGMKRAGPDAVGRRNYRWRRDSPSARVTWDAHACRR